MRSAVRALVGLRAEEIPALLFLLPSAAVTAKAWLFYVNAGLPVPPRIEHGVWRIVLTALGMVAFFWAVHRWPAWRHLGWLRDLAPFGFCILVYTNLHDTIHFVNSHDVHDALIAVDQWMFGVQPTVWMQHYYHPLLTDYFSLAYMNYFLISVSLVIWLLVARRRADLRAALFGTVLCFYVGYVLYILFPAAPPRLVLADQFVRDFSGGWLTDAQRRLVEISPTSSRGAFPSLHCAITLITVMYAWKLARPLFWILLVPAASLVVSTVYLRHHYVVDIYAGFALAAGVYPLAPRVAAAWGRVQARLGVSDDDGMPDAEPAQLAPLE